MTTLSASKLFIDLTPHELAEAAVARGEAVRSATGALTVTTGKRTGRSPKDRFIVEDATTASTVDWGSINQPMTSERFSHLWQQAEQYLQGREVYVSHLQVGADAHYGLPVTVMTEWAWHNLFACHLFIRPDAAHPLQHQQAWTILSVPGLHTDPAVDGVNSDAVLVLNFTERKILLIGLQYAGEIKKAMFTVMNFLLPPQQVLPMHCAANQGKAGDTALFFGLSGTGKTTLSADPNRLLIGDDEHGWSATRIFNFEGGCYAKCINLSQAREPMIWDAIRGDAIMENVVLDEHGRPDFDDTHLTENTRAAYPRDYIAARVLDNAGPVPSAVIFLTCDLYGVLPPVALLTKEQAAYYFLSGYTALVGSTEVGRPKGVSPTFSTCFGAPFFPRRPSEYADLLMQRIAEAGVPVYLVNTGYTGGSYGKGGERFSIPTTRAIITAILEGAVRKAPTQCLPIFNLVIPTQVPGVSDALLNPPATWSDAQAYTEAARELAQKFQANFKRFHVDAAVAAAGPMV